MGILYKRKEYKLAAAAAITLCIMMIVFSDIAMLSAKKGLALWSSSILPAMLPFFICVNFINGIGLTALLPVKIFPFIMSALSGYPMGAKIIGDMYRNGVIDIYEARKLISYCSTSGPVFMVGAVGVGMLGSKTAGYVIAVSHYAGAILNGVFFSAGNRNSHVTQIMERNIEEFTLLETLTMAIFAAFKSVAVILAYMIFFTFVIDMLELLNVFDLIDSPYMLGLLRGSIEMTVGCGSLPHYMLISDCMLAAVIISWGGLSILGQSMSMLAGTGISFGYLAITKLTHSIFAGIISLFLGKLML